MAYGMGNPIANAMGSIDNIVGDVEKYKFRKLGEKFLQHGDFTPQGLQKFAQENDLDTDNMFKLVNVIKEFNAFKKSQQPAPDKKTPKEAGGLLGMLNETKNTFEPSTYAGNQSPFGPVRPGIDPVIAEYPPEPKLTPEQENDNKYQLWLKKKQWEKDNPLPDDGSSNSGANYNEEAAVGKMEGFITQEDVDPLQAKIEIEKFNRVAVRPYIYSTDPGKKTGWFDGERDVAPSVKKINLPKTSDGIQATTEDVRAYQQKYGTDWQTAVNKIFEFAGQKSPY